MSVWVGGCVHAWVRACDIYFVIVLLVILVFLTGYLLHYIFSSRIPLLY